MGIRIELTDDDLPEAKQITEISPEEIENLPAVCQETKAEILLTIIGREDGGIEIHHGSSGYILLGSEKEAERFCESIIRQIRHLPTFRSLQS